MVKTARVYSLPVVLALGLASAIVPIVPAIAHGDKKIEIPAGQPVPTVDLAVYPDAQKGWNVEIKTTNFRFAPERINQDSRTTEGHAHLYLNGKKLTRLYGSWYYLESLPPGENRLMVTLNTNRHEDLAYKGEIVRAMAIVRVPR